MGKLHECDRCGAIFKARAHKASFVTMFRYSKWKVFGGKDYEWYLCRNCTRALRKDFLGGYKSKTPTPNTKDPLIEHIKAGGDLTPIESDDSVGTGFRTYP